MKEMFIVGPKHDPYFDGNMFNPDDTLTPLVESDKTMAHVLQRIGKFKSVSDAKRNGWDVVVPTGFNQFTIGKGPNRMDVFIWNPQTTMAEFRSQNPGLS